MKRLNFGFSTLGCPQASWEEIGEISVRHGLPGIELRILSGRQDLAAALEQAFGNPQNMAAEVKAAGAKIVAVNSSLNILGGEGWDEVADLARWADVLQVPWIRVFDGGEKGQFGAGTRRSFVSRMEEWTEFRKRLGVKTDIMVETHTSLTKTEDCVALAQDLREVGLPLNLLWDVFHTWKMGARDLRQTWATLKPWVRHIHVKDGLADDHLTLPGKGVVPVKELLRLLEEDGFEGPVHLEWEAYWNRALPSIEEAIVSGRRADWW